jgi:hypothetical protein
MDKNQKDSDRQESEVPEKEKRNRKRRRIHPRIFSVWPEFPQLPTRIRPRFFFSLV